LHQTEESSLPLLPNHSPSSVAIPAVFQVGRLLHANGDADFQILVGAAFRHRHLVPFGRSGAVRSRPDHHLAKLFVLEGDDVFHFGVEFDLHGGEWVLGHEVALGVPSRA
jgi:hypothetical protein